ncbi:hypothetical protein [Actinopolymorpha singaporensis]|uniref:Uncharacterized protein n=1 Tax=Actinopolymorpha singaporensis TaxID=117157 RepID=A0A1H1VFC9_9ACTN|nr:hypothetical protein [Actinopolymorpha singaporensis]SDS83131.1 hypothetical protein SAMN04489717_4029 [Actinopolymorpha singaporensis]
MRSSATAALVTAATAARPARHRRRRVPAAPSALLLLSVLAVLAGNLLSGPQLPGSPPVPSSAAAGIHAVTPATASPTDTAGEHTVASVAPVPERGERPDAAVVAGAPLVSWVHGLNSTLPDQAPTLGATVASAPPPGATRQVHAAHTDHHASRAPPQA